MPVATVTRRPLYRRIVSRLRRILFSTARRIMQRLIRFHTFSAEWRMDVMEERIRLCEARATELHALIQGRVSEIADEMASFQESTSRRCLNLEAFASATNKNLQGIEERFGQQDRRVRHTSVMVQNALHSSAASRRDMVERLLGLSSQMVAVQNRTEILLQRSNEVIAVPIRMRKIEGSVNSLAGEVIQLFEQTREIKQLRRIDDEPAILRPEEYINDHLATMESKVLGWAERLEEHVRQTLEGVVDRDVLKQDQADLEERISSTFFQATDEMEGALLDLLYETEQGAKRSVSGMLTELADIQAKQSEINSALQNIEAFRLRLDDMYDNKQIDGISCKLQDLEARLNLATSEKRADALEAGVADLSGQVSLRLEECDSRLAEVSHELAKFETRFTVPVHMSRPVYGPGSPMVKGAAKGDFDYVAFESVFRGTEELVRARLAVYVPFFEGRDPVLDVGCGRGEFLKLLMESAIEAVGVDSNHDMVRRCKVAGLTQVENVNALEHLADETHSYGGIFSAQVIEHLHFDALQSFLRMSYGRLREGGLFIAETVNPLSIEALRTFYVDPTHIKPLFPDVMLFIAKWAGFPKAEVFYPNGGGFDESEPWNQHEYALVAWK